MKNIKSSYDETRLRYFFKIQLMFAYRNFELFAKVRLLPFSIIYGSLSHLNSYGIKTNSKHHYYLAIDIEYPTIMPFRVRLVVGR
jgi:hypothetical protein